MKIPRLLHRITAGLRCRLISRDGAPYLERYYLGRVGPVTAYLHRFVAGDGDQEVHDHPWRALSIVLTGHYDEFRAHLSGRAGVVGPVRRVRFFNAIGLRSLHQITRTRPDTWTLFLIGPRRKGWGFFRVMSEGTATGVLYYQPYEAFRAEDWTTAPLGRDSGRESAPEKT